MDLEELINYLEACDPDIIAPVGFNNPHSYRGYYNELAFEPALNISLGEMLASAKSAMGKTFQGYKGGDFEMGKYTQCWLAHYGRTGEVIGETLLSYMSGNPTMISE